MKLLSSLLLLLMVSSLSAAEKPNIILIYTDDHGWPDIGAAGIYDDLKTPHLDALAASGVRATNGYSTAPQCVPSRAGLLAGRSQNRFGVDGNGDSLEGFNAQRTIAERLKEVGYRTAQIGKWHLGPGPEIPDHGFDVVYAKNANRPCHANFTLDGEIVPMGLDSDKLYHLDACSEAAVAFIHRDEDDPFFIYLAYRAPHVPLDAPKKYLNRFPGEMPERRRQALAMISAMDDGVGQIRAALEERGLLENTLIFFIGDNGAPLKIHKIDAPGGGPGWDGSLNEPLNGEKGMLAEGGIRVPFLISWPGTFPAGQVYEHPLVTLDVAATANAIAGLPEDPVLDGVNLVPWLSGEKSGAPHASLQWRWIAQSAIRQGKWKLLKGGSREYLYDLEADPGESNNLLSQYPEIASRLRSELGDWSQELDPPGLAAGPMPDTWENYFDHYLDGKLAKLDVIAPGTRAEGWTARNSTLERSAGGLKVLPDQKRRPFLTRNDLTLGKSFTVALKLRSENAGGLAVSWRTQTEKDFVDGALVKTRVTGTDWEEHRLNVNADAQVIHLRILLPDAESEIESIRILNPSEKVIFQTHFPKL